MNPEDHRPFSWRDLADRYVIIGGGLVFLAGCVFIVAAFITGPSS